MKKIFLAFLLLSNFLAANTQAQSARVLESFQPQFFIQGTDTLPYRVLLPEGYKPNKKYPLVLFLHGAGERGRNNRSQLVHGAALFADSTVRKNFPAIVIFPQCAPGSYWSNVNIKTDEKGKRQFNFNPSAQDPTKDMRLLMALVQKLPSLYKLETRRMYIGGLSMGAMGTYELLYRTPGIFAAAIAICGGGDPSTAPVLKQAKWKIFHGAKDDVVPPHHSEQMAAALKEAGAEVSLTVYPEANHNSWDPTFAEPNLLPWLFAQKKKKK